MTDRSKHPSSKSLIRAACSSLTMVGFAGFALVGVALAQDTATEPAIDASNNDSRDILDTLKDKPLNTEISHNPDNMTLDTVSLPMPVQASIVIPVEALKIPSVARSVGLTARDPESGVAIEGYDPVAYFTKGEPRRGSSEFRADYNGATYYFETAEHRDLFIADADQYAPAYGGYCTQTLASGSLTPASPTNFTINGNRLFLTRSQASTKEFRERQAETVNRANFVWEDVNTNLAYVTEFQKNN